MRAMILAAGRGEGLRPYTDETPKPLIKVGRRSLIENQLFNLRQAGFSEVVINVAYRAEQIMATLGSGERFGLNIIYSYETDGGLETGGGIYRALPFLGKDPFLVMSADIWTEFPLETLLRNIEHDAHLVLVPNPSYHPEGDFYFDHGKVVPQGTQRYTYASFGIFHPQMFDGCGPGRYPVAPLIYQSVEAGRVTGELYEGKWVNVGTPERLEEVIALQAS